MKKIYITPRVVVNKCVLESFIASSPVKNADATLDDITTPITPKDDDDDDVILHSKQFTAWDTWD